jgi:intracellular septation protein A
MKLLFLGLVPVVIFWFVEEKLGTFWGLIAAIVWAVGECIYEYTKTRKIEGLTLFSTGLVVILGGIGALLDKSILFKFQPVIMELVFAGILVWGGRSGEPLLFKMAKKSRPEIFNNPNPFFIENQMRMMKRLTRNLIFILIIHSALLSFVAVKGSTGQWAFWKGVGFNVFILVWAVSEFLILRLKNRKPTM